MLFLLTVVLFASSVGMFLLLYAKHWELTTGKLIFASARPSLSRVSSRVLMALERHMPLMLRNASRSIGLWLRTRARDALARALLSVEHSLESLLHHLKHSLSPAKGAAGAASSAFLREVAEQKHRLTRVARVRREPASESIANPDAKQYR